MLSDESSSDSETGRFKGQSKSEDKPSKTASDIRDRFKSSSSRSRFSDNDRFRRESDRKRDDKDRYTRRSRSRDRHRQSRRSPINKKRCSRERSPKRRSRERQVPGSVSRDRSKTRDQRNNSRDRGRHSRSRSHKSAEPKKDLRDEIKKTISSKLNSPEKKNLVIDKSSSSPDYRGKKSEIYKPVKPPEKRKSDSPIIVEDYENSEKITEVVQPGSYYKMIPAVVKEKEKSEESSEIDSSDDERLRAKLLNLEKELHKTRKKKHRKKHKQKASKAKKEKDTDSSAVEVTSTTDILDNDKVNEAGEQLSGPPEVTSTQKNQQKASSEEGEILSDDSQNAVDIDASDLRHRLKRHKAPEQDVCGPALPPHLQSKFSNRTPNVEGPALPPSSVKKPRNIGPSIPDGMREVLATKETEVVQYESSDEDVGIGPLPTGLEEKWSDAHKKLEERALEIKINKLNGPSKADVKGREKWMLELPEGKAKILGLEARSFRAKEGPDMSDRSSWTDTPEEKARKAAGILKPEDLDKELKEDTKALLISKRDDEQESAVKKHKKKHKRDESLLELHQKKLKKKKKKDDKDSDGKQERRPFGRDVDLQVNRFDEAQKKSIIKKAQHLDTRFSSGEAKYL